MAVYKPTEDCLGRMATAFDEDTSVTPCDSVDSDWSNNDEDFSECIFRMNWLALYKAPDTMRGPRPRLSSRCYCWNGILG